MLVNYGITKQTQLNMIADIDTNVNPIFKQCNPELKRDENTVRVCESSNHELDF